MVDRTQVVSFMEMTRCRAQRQNTIGVTIPIERFHRIRMPPENPFEGIAAQSQIPATMKLIIEVIKSGDKGFSFHQTKEIQVSFI